MYFHDFYYTRCQRQDSPDSTFMGIILIVGLDSTQLRKLRPKQSAKSAKTTDPQVEQLSSGEVIRSCGALTVHSLGKRPFRGSLFPRNPLNFSPRLPYRLNHAFRFSGFGHGFGLRVVTVVN